MTLRCGKCKECAYWTDECKRINLSVNNGKGNPHLPGETLCWCCKNAVPDAEGRRGCEWSIYNQKVPGWDADRVILSDQEECRTWSYIVKRCPKFVRG